MAIQPPALSLTSLAAQGFALAESAVDQREIAELSTALDELEYSKAKPGLRNLLSRCPKVREFAQSDTAGALARHALSGFARPVRAILFDKSPASNWYVTWHQDLTIPVVRKIDVVGFGPWTRKDEHLHVQPPADILEQMISLRIHLDDTPEDNGAIKFIPGSHLSGILDPGAIVEWRSRESAISQPARSGDIILMRPMILHSSAVSKTPSRRRVLHIEYAGTDLPGGLEWAEA